MDRRSIHATRFYLGEKAANLADRWGLKELSNTLDSRFRAGSGTVDLSTRWATNQYAEQPCVFCILRFHFFIVYFVFLIPDLLYNLAGKRHVGYWPV